MEAIALLVIRLARVALLASAFVASNVSLSAGQTVLVPPKPFVWDETRSAPDFSVLDEGRGIIKSRTAAIALGKALFWDQAIGSDNNACASCHFSAGADPRLTNQLHPGFKDITFGAKGDTKFGSLRSDTGGVQLGYMMSGAKADSNYKLKPEDMPLHKLSDETVRNSPIVSTTNDRVSSQGSFAALFTLTRPGIETCSNLDKSIFHAGGAAARQVEPRNTPSMINAVFQDRQFWDGRANNLFNGVGVFGMRDIDEDKNKRLLKFSNGNPFSTYLKIENASLASQAVGPPLSNLEMSCDTRRFPDIARKVLPLTPLSVQAVSKTDSVLGPLVKSTGYGLSSTYAALIKQAFDDGWTSASSQKYKISNGVWFTDTGGYTQIENNFSMFWGVAIMMYEATLISNQSEFDTLQAQGKLVVTARPGTGNPGRCTSPNNDVDPLLLRGCSIFVRSSNGSSNPPEEGTPGTGYGGPPNTPTSSEDIPGGNCLLCHISQGAGANRPKSPMLTEGTTSANCDDPAFAAIAALCKPEDNNPQSPKHEVFNIFLNPPTDVLGQRELRDQGFGSIGLREVFTDLMSGGTDPYGQPLSYGRQYWQYLDAVAAGDAGASKYLRDPVLRRLILTPTAGGNKVGDGGSVEPPRTSTNAGGTFKKLDVDGSSKVPILRNVALTPPYFSWGGYPNLRQLLKVYNRGMNRRHITSSSDPDNYRTAPSDPNALRTECLSGDNSGTGPDGNTSFETLKSTSGLDCNTNTTGSQVPLGLADCEAPNGTAPRLRCINKGYSVSNDDLAALESFLKSLTDPRVQCSAAPFDHPGLLVTDGHIPVTKVNYTVKATDIKFLMPPAGATGYAKNSGYCIPNAGDLFAKGMQALSGGAKAPALP